MKRQHRWIVILGGRKHRCHFTICANCRHVMMRKSKASMKVAKAPCTSSWADDDDG